MTQIEHNMLIASTSELHVGVYTCMSGSIIVAQSSCESVIILFTSYMYNVATCSYMLFNKCTIVSMTALIEAYSKYSCNCIMPSHSVEQR